MTDEINGFLAAATATANLLDDPAVAARWAQPSALTDMSVGALAGHLARQVSMVEQLLPLDPGQEPPIPLAEHYARAAWNNPDRADQANAGIRATAATEAQDGPAAVAERARAAATRLAAALPGLPPDQPVRLPWGPWSLTLADLLVTRMMEMTVHGDDLAVSVGLTAPELPAPVTDTVIVLLARLAVRRHGATALIRALSRAERAPATIAAF
jgi:uncharacterized protein (TIGR03083 family)